MIKARLFQEEDVKSLDSSTVDDGQMDSTPTTNTSSKTATINSISTSNNIEGSI